MKMNREFSFCTTEIGLILLKFDEAFSFSMFKFYAYPMIEEVF